MTTTPSLRVAKTLTIMAQAMWQGFMLSCHMRCAKYPVVGAEGRSP